MSDPLSGLEALDGAGAGDPAEAPPAPARRGRKKKPSGAAYRRRKKQVAASLQDDAAAPAGETPAQSPDPETASETPAAEENAAGLEEARRVIADPDTGDFIEELYRMPFHEWAQAVGEPAIEPAPEKVKRVARMLRRMMDLYPGAWMRHLPLIFLLVAIGEDVMNGVRHHSAASRRKKEEERGRAGAELVAQKNAEREGAAA